MKHFIVGPVEMYPCTKEIYNSEIVYFRTPDFSNIVLDCLDKLSCFLGNNEKNSLIYLTASGTAAMEAAVENCVSESDKVLVINGGTFGRRFCELLAHHNKTYSEIKLSWGEVLEKSHFEDFENKGYTMLFVNLHETSTGQLYDINLISDFCKRNNMLLVVDAISTFLADEYDMQKYGIDLTIISSQKGLCISPGLSIISVSKRMKDKILSLSSSKTMYFNLSDYFKNIERGQTPYTPAVNIVYELRAILTYIEKTGGVQNWISFVQDKAKYFRKKALSLDFKIPDCPLSYAITPVIFDDIDATQVVKILKDKYQIFVNPCGGDLAQKQIRIAHIGNTTLDDIDDLLDKMSKTVNEIKAGALLC